jgi:EmrB/QacA subfamily drug resistance transporter
MSDTVMAPGEARPAREQVSGARPGERRWVVLVVMAVAQLMVALDATIVSIALPSAQRALHFTDSERQWMLTAYTLAFGGLLLLGGRVADSVGRKRALLVGLAGFAAASAVGGSAAGFWILVAARALQGAFAALLAPTALSLLAVTFTEPRERARAFAVFGMVAGSGAAVGLLAGGLLTQALDWRWCLFVNIPIAAFAGVAAWRVLSRDGAATAAARRFDVPGAALATGGLVALVYACSRAAVESWSSRGVIALLGASLLLLSLFVIRQTRAAVPLLPLHIVLDRNRGGAQLSAMLAIAGMFGAFLFLTYYLQVVLRYSPVQAGLAFLPLVIGSQVGSLAIASRLMPHLPPRALIVPGALVSAAGMLVLTQLPVSGGYWTHVLPAEILLGIGTACVMVAAISTATLGVDPRQAGAAAAAVGTAQQVGASLGTALLTPIAAGATAGYLAGRPAAPAVVAQGLVHGYSTATAVGAAILALGAVLALLMIDARRPSRRAGGPGGR